MIAPQPPSSLPNLSRAFSFDAGRSVIVFGLAVIAVLWGCIAWHIGRERTRVLVDAATGVSNLAQVLDAHLQRTIAGLDQTLLVLKAEYQRDPDKFSLNAAVGYAAAARGIALQISLLDARGMLKDSTTPGFAPVNLADREHFQVHLVPNSTLFISKPVQGRTSGKWSIQLTRRLDRPDGGLAGVLVVSLDPSYLTEIYRSIDVGPNGAVALLGRDGVIRAAISSGKPQIGGSVADQALTEQIFDSRVGSIRAPGFLGETVRLLGYRTLTEAPMAVVVGRSIDGVLASHADTLFDDIVLGVLLTVAMGAALALLYRLVHRQELTARALASKKAELVASRERLKRYVADLERIAEVAAHDLQEPLRRVVAYTQLLAKHAENALDAEGRDYVAQVVAGAQRMRKLVSDLEAYVAVDHLPEVDALTPAGSAVTAATERLAEPLREKSAMVKVGRLPDVAADERSLTEIFTQLLDNAVRYSCPGRSAMIEVSAKDDGRVATFAVRDNGIGIEESARIRLFEIFHRLRGLDGQDGTGIGLATARRIVEHLGGHIWVESVPGEGSTFLFTLPMTVRSKQEGRDAQAA
ncbi:MAG: hypothetical protein HQL42_06060 [Alphaproteobacteria bacterium]|nr:hypothetical protein [Alphaproteobacteria bacterium]